MQITTNLCDLLITGLIIAIFDCSKTMFVLQIRFCRILVYRFNIGKKRWQFNNSHCFKACFKILNKLLSNECNVINAMLKNMWVAQFNDPNINIHRRTTFSGCPFSESLLTSVHQLLHLCVTSWTCLLEGDGLTHHHMHFTVSCWSPVVNDGLDAQLHKCHCCSGSCCAFSKKVCKCLLHYYPGQFEPCCSQATFLLPSSVLCLQQSTKPKIITCVRKLS